MYLPTHSPFFMHFGLFEGQSLLLLQAIKEKNSHVTYMYTRVKNYAKYGGFNILIFLRSFQIALRGACLLDFIILQKLQTIQHFRT